MSTETVAVVGILTSGVLGPAVFAWFAGRRQARELKHEVAKELREVLDESAAALARSRRTNQWVVRLWRKGVPGSDDRVLVANAEQRESVEAARVAQDRLSLRLGHDHPTVAQYRRAQEVLDEVVGVVQDHAGREPIDPFVGQINEIGRRYGEEWKAFVSLAHKLHVGLGDRYRPRVRLVRGGGGSNPESPTAPSRQAR
jgi:hypothetical protein